MIQNKLKIGVVGATGIVGQTFMKILEERQFPVAELRPFASENSLGKKINLHGQDWECQVLQEGCFRGLDLVFFSSGDDISKEWAPRAVAEGAFAVDNSAAFRMDDLIHLVVPEVNGHLLSKNSKPQIIANPNCSTIQLVVALKNMRDQFGISEVRVSSYQAVSGPKLKVSAFTVRVPVLNAHSESVWVTLNKEITREHMLHALETTPGLVVVDEPRQAQYPMPREVSGRDPVYVGRVHRDLENPNLWLMWVVSDNIRKGAALNGIQIAELLF